MNTWSATRAVEKTKPVQQSVASLPVPRQAAAMSAVDEAIARYPAIMLETGERLHVCEMAGEWEVWLNCADADFTGLCVAVGATRQHAVTDAVRVFEAAVDALQGPPPELIP